MSLVASILTKENAANVLAKIEFKSKAEIEALITQYRPVTSTPRDRIIPKLIHKPSFAEPSLSLFSSDAAKAGIPVAPMAERNKTEGEPTCPTPTSTSPNLSEQSDHEPPAPTTFELRTTVSAETLQKMKRVQTLLAKKLHRVPTYEEVLAAMASEYLEHKDPVQRLRRREQLRTRRDNPKPTDANPKLRSPGTVTSRHIPAAIRDEVFTRDGLSCTFRGPDGTQCGCEVGLALDHCRPFALGGDHAGENLRVLCAKHNALVAKRVFGEESINRKVLQKKRSGYS